METVRNVADKEQVIKGKEREKRSQERHIEDWQSVLSTRQGRRVIWDLIEFCGVYETSFTGNSQTFFNEGQRNVGLKIVKEICEADPQAYLDMMKNKGEL